MKKQWTLLALFLLGLGIQANANQSVSAYFEVVSNWANGAQINISLTNSGAPLSAWDLEYNSDLAIQNFWNADVVSSNGTVTASNLAWNGTITTGQTITFGMVVSHTGNVALPQSATLNGAAITVSNNLPSVEFYDLTTTVYAQSNSPQVHIIANTSGDEQSIEFTKNGAPISFGLQVPGVYVLHDNTPELGTFEIVAKVTGSNGLVGYDTVTYYVVEDPSAVLPSVSFAALDEYIEQSNNPILHIIASVNSNVSEVSFTSNGTPITFGLEAPGSYAFHSNTPNLGTFEVIAAASNSYGQTAYDTIVYTVVEDIEQVNAPEIVITDPTEGQIVYNPSTRNSFNATVTDNGTIVEVLFIVESDTLAPYYGPNPPYYDAIFDPSTYNSGLYDLTVIATDDEGTSSSKTVSFEVVNYTSAKIARSEVESTGSAIVYPNPTSSQINVDGAVEIKLFDVNNKLVKVVYASVMDVSDFASGNYFVQAKTDETTLSQAIIIQ